MPTVEYVTACGGRASQVTAWKRCEQAGVVAAAHHCAALMSAALAGFARRFVRAGCAGSCILVAEHAALLLRLRAAWKFVLGKNAAAPDV